MVRYNGKPKWYDEIDCNMVRNNGNPKSGQSDSKFAINNDDESDKDIKILLTSFKFSFEHIDEKPSLLSRLQSSRLA